VYAIDGGTGATVAHRADERFAFCSTFKALATAAVLTRPIEYLDTLVNFSAAELVGHSPMTEQHRESGMTIRELCDAAVRYSDGTAGNLLLREIGGPGELTAFVRSLGDAVFRMDRTEPDITEAIPGDPRDTTSPRAFASTLRTLILGDALRPDAAHILIDLMIRNTTGNARIRAGVPPRWLVADKTGSGDYGTANDIAVLWPTAAPPLVVAIMSSRPGRDDEPSSALIAEVTARVLDVFQLAAT
jgi:beta-lactamase class A